MRKMNPSAKLIGLIAVTMTLAAAHHPILNFAVFIAASAACLADLVKTHRKFHLFLYPMIPVAVLAFSMFMTGYRFTGTPSSVVSIHLLSSSSLGSIPSNVWNGMIFSSRVLVYAAIGLLFALTSDPVEMIRSFQKQLHLPQMFAYGLLSAWNIFPHMAQEYRKTRLSFLARGIRVRPYSPRLLITLLVKTTRWSEELAMAMESRGFSSKLERSSYQTPKLYRCDLIFLLLSCVVFPVISFLVF